MCMEFSLPLTTVSFKIYKYFRIIFFKYSYFLDRAAFCLTSSWSWGWVGGARWLLAVSKTAWQLCGTEQNLSVLAKWLDRKTPLRKPNRDEGIISTKPRPENVYDFLGLVYCFVMWLSCPLAQRNIFRTPMARHSLFVLKLKVPLNTKQLT